MAANAESLANVKKVETVDARAFSLLAETLDHKTDIEFILNKTKENENNNNYLYGMVKYMTINGNVSESTIDRFLARLIILMMFDEINDVTISKDEKKNILTYINKHKSIKDIVIFILEERGIKLNHNNLNHNNLNHNIQLTPEHFTYPANNNEYGMYGHYRNGGRRIKHIRRTRRNRHRNHKRSYKNKK